METLRDKVKLDNNDNYILFEQGGIGKTSQMKAVFRSYALSHKDGIVPIFVDCKTIDFNRKQPLLTHILLEFCGEDCPDNYESSIVRLENMLTKANSKYKYVFFIDGINECENNKYLVVQDIAKLLKSPNNKIIVSSRINENDIGLKDFKRLKVKEFTDAQIVIFLNSKGFKDNGNDVELNRLNPSLLKILRVPMFLRLFVETYSADNIFPDMYTGNIVRKADLLQAFINKIFDDKNEQHSSENDPEYIKRQFSLERYLPTLAYEMMLMHKYSINNEVFKNLRTQVFNSNYFERFENEDEEIFENISSIKKINNICIEEFSLLNKSNDNYAFFHQVWQDFFCGKFYELCIKYDVLEPFENAMPESVKQFIGEIIGECDFEKKMNFLENSSPLELFLHKNFENDDNPKALLSIRNITNVMKICRKNKITANYSNLNLTMCDFRNSYITNCNFTNCKIHPNIFNSPNDEFFKLKSYKYIESEDLIYLIATNGSINTYNINNGNIREVYSVEKDKAARKILSFDKIDCNKYVVRTYEQDLLIYNTETQEIEQTLYGKKLVLSNGKNVDSLKFIRYGSIRNFHIFNSIKTIFFINNRFVHRWDYKDNLYSGGLLIDASNIADYSISTDGRIIVTISQHHKKSLNGTFESESKLRFWNGENGKEIPSCISGENYKNVMFIGNNTIGIVEYREVHNSKGVKSRGSIKFFKIGNEFDIELIYEIKYKDELFGYKLKNIDDNYFVCFSSGKILVIEKSNFTVEHIIYLKRYADIKDCDVLLDKNLIICYSKDIVRVLDYEFGEEINSYQFSENLPSTQKIKYLEKQKEIYFLLNGCIKKINNSGNLFVKDTYAIDCHIRDVILSDNKFMATYSWDEEVSLWDTEKRTKIWSTNINAQGCSISGFSKNNELIVCRSFWPDKLICINAHNGEIVMQKYEERNIDFADKKRTIINNKYVYDINVINDFLLIKIYSVETKELITLFKIKQLMIDNSNIRCIQSIIYFFEKNELLISGLTFMNIFDATGRIVQKISDFVEMGTDRSILVDGVIEPIDERYLIIGCSGGILIYDIEQKKVVKKNNKIITANIIGSDFSKAIFLGNDSERNKFYDIVIFNGGKI